MKYYMVYGITDCPSCLRAAALLMEKDEEYVTVEADFSKTYRRQIRDELNWATFPIVVLMGGPKNIVIGGFDELEKHIGVL